MIPGQREVAARIVEVVLDDLRDRGGVGNELEQIEEDVMAEMRSELTDRVDEVLDDATSGLVLL